MTQLDPVTNPLAQASPGPSNGRAWIEIDVARLRHNFRALRSRVPDHAKVMAVVKADAYGHGAAQVAQVFVDEGVDALGVAIPEEGVQLREVGIGVPILVFGGVPPGQEEQIVSRELTPTVYTVDALERLSEAARKQGRVVGYHLKIDTGMGRIGIEGQRVASFLSSVEDVEGVRLDGIYTHFSSADEEDQAYTNGQLERFHETVVQLYDMGISGITRHTANSAGLLHYPLAAFDMVRTGIALYGVHPRQEQAVAPIASVLSVKSVVSFVKTVPGGTPLGYNRRFVTYRDSRIATVPIGYADGISRHMSDVGMVLVRGQFARMVGAINMDSLLIDVTDIADAASGDEVVLIGGQGGAEITAHNIAEWAGTAPHDVLSSLGPRLPRLYFDGD